MEKTNLIWLKINPNAPTDRRDLFARACNALNIDIIKEMEACGVNESKKNNPIVNVEHLMKFFQRNKLKGSFNFSDQEKTLRVLVEEKHVATPKAVLEVPEAIKNTSVDDMNEKDSSGSSAPKPGSDLTPMKGIDSESEDDDDDPF